jgi:dihydrofolate reductase
MNTIKAIAAMSENRVIGSSGDIPWHLPEDFKWFKKTTMGAILVMGRKTFESIGRPLPGRDTYVISRSSKEIPDVQVFTNLKELEQIQTERTIWIAGGGEIYQQMLNKCSELYLTRVHREVDGDAYFPKFEDEFTRKSILTQNKDFSIEHWIHK